MRNVSYSVVASSVAFFTVLACGSVDHSLGRGPAGLDTAGYGGSSSSGGSRNTGGSTSSGGSIASGGSQNMGGSSSAGASTSSGGSDRGGSTSSGGATSSGGSGGSCGPRSTGGTGGAGNYKMCGGIAAIKCDPGFTCVDNPYDDCDPNCGGADCGGICVPDRKPLRCGTILGLTCPDGMKCLDDPSDSCAPGHGADCGGICVGEFALRTCGGFRTEPQTCPEKWACVDDWDDSCHMAADCGGYCGPDPRIGVSCDRSKVLCKMAEPACPKGYTVSVIGSCFGPCVPLDVCSCTSPRECPNGAVCSDSGFCTGL